MDRWVDQASGTVATHESDAPEDVAEAEDGEAEDIESELQSSTREMGISAVGVVPDDD